LKRRKSIAIIISISTQRKIIAYITHILSLHTSTQVKMKLFILVMLHMIFLTKAADIPLCVANTMPEAAADLCMTCSADADQCTPCSQDACMNGKYYIQFDDKDAWSMTYLSITSSTKDAKYDPDRIVIRGSNDFGDKWTKLTTQDLSWSNRSSENRIYFNNEKTYKSYQVELSKLDGVQSMYIGDMTNPKTDPPPTQSPTNAPTNSPTNFPTNAPTSITNIARQGSASQTCTHEHGSAWKAIDGRYSGNWDDKQMAHTCRANGQWLLIKFSKDATIKMVRIWNRTNGESHRLSYSEVQIRNASRNVVDKKNIGSASGRRYVDANFNYVVGRDVLITKGGSEEYNIAEVEIFGHF